MTLDSAHRNYSDICLRPQHLSQSPAAQTATSHAHLPFVNELMSSIQSRSREASGDLAATPKRPKLDLQWAARFNELKTYKDEHGNCNVPRRKRRMGLWVIRQRQLCNKGKLSHGRIVQLESIGFAWDPFKEMWMARFDELRQYKKNTVITTCHIPRVNWVNG